MLRKLLFTLAVVLSANALVFAQSGTLKGKIKDKGTGESVSFAGVVLEQGGRVVSSLASDIDGNYTIKPLAPGKYDLKVSYIGYGPKQVNGIVIKAENITFQDIDLDPTSVTMNEFVVTEYAIPLIDRDGGSTETVDSKQISKMAGRSVDAVVSTMGGVFNEDGRAGSVRGARAEGTITYVDGVKVLGASVPSGSIEQITVMTGGLPAQYGDATGGVINITTKGPSPVWRGGLELLTSEMFDKYGYNLMSFNVTGPLLMVRSKIDTTKKKPIMGLFFAGELSTAKDGFPGTGGFWKLNDDKLAQLTAQPLRTASMFGGTYRNGEFIHKSDLVNIKTRENVRSNSANFTGKIDIKTSKNTNLTLGGTFSYGSDNDYISSFSLANSKNNPFTTGNSLRLFARFTQKFDSENSKDKKRDLIKNVYYTLQADYSRAYSLSEDPEKKDNLFQYGHIGTFKTQRTKSYTVADTIVKLIDAVKHDTLKLVNARIFTGMADTNVLFTPSKYNPDASVYTQYVYDNFNKFSNLTAIQQMGGLLNGDAPPSIYSLYANTGTIYNNYSKGVSTQASFNASASADVGNHAIQFGFQYEQKSSSSVSYSPVGLWTITRQLVNKHIQELDRNAWSLTTTNLGNGGTGYYNYQVDFLQKYDQSHQALVDINLRKKLGLPVNGLDWIDVDALDPNLLSVSMFAPDELLNDGKSYASAYGYDYSGKLLKKTPSLDDFFTAKDENGFYKREVGAYQPIYIAGYIQDKFAFNDLIFNIGLRVDRFDANQKVLKDPYSLFETNKAGDVTSMGEGDAKHSVTHPQNIGSDYVVYVDKQTSPTMITGYRNGSRWYNAQGVEVTDPNLLASATGINPFLVNPSQTVINQTAFKDYQPQINYLPRITFSFPISDEALFFAHYDVLTKRPTDGIRLNPANYLFINSIGTGFINNPNLMPEKTIDYELGFQQKLSNTSSLKVETYYREMRNMVQVMRMSGAYPVSYNTYGNIDFGTVKGMTFTYDLRQTKNIWLKASYTLQFADGTGSEAGSGVSLVNSGQPNLRTVSPLNFDRRHQLSAVIDYRYSDGKEYNGPKITRIVKDKDGNEKVKVYKILENTGANLTFSYGSGVPYSKQSNITGLTTGGNTLLQGEINGARMPGQFKIDARIDKDIMLKLGGKNNKNAKVIAMNIYLQILNVLNTQNILSVYRATGTAKDDGYLTAAEFQNTINAQTDPQAFRDLYTVAMQSPYNYTLPRTIRLGLQLNF